MKETSKISKLFQSPFNVLTPPKTIRKQKVLTTKRVISTS